jgi:hypothetical protein
MNRYFYLLAIFISIALAGCSGRTLGSSIDRISVPDEELALYMNDMQRYSDKLGYSLEAKNDRLAMFYLEELEETLDALLDVDEVEGIPIAESIEAIMDPLIGQLAESLRNEDWKGGRVHYEALVDGCNRCHAATEHEFIRVIPANGSGKGKYNQIFSR